VIQCGLKTTTKKVNQTGTSCLFTIFFSTASAVTRHLATTTPLLLLASNLMEFQFHEKTKFDLKKF
jgi:hypothetical protein